MGRKKKVGGTGALNNRIKLVVKSGKYVIGWNEVLRALRQVQSFPSTYPDPSSAAPNSLCGEASLGHSSVAFYDGQQKVCSHKRFSKRRLASSVRHFCHIKARRLSLLPYSKGTGLPAAPPSFQHLWFPPSFSFAKHRDIRLALCALFSNYPHLSLCLSPLNISLLFNPMVLSIRRTNPN